MIKRQDSSSINSGDNSWLLICSALVFIMIPGLGFYYSGFGYPKNAILPIILCFISLSVISIQWTLFGYSLSFSDKSKSYFIGDFYYGLFINIGENINLVAPTVPAVTFAIFQCIFCAITSAISIGSVSNRIRILPTTLFFFLWATFVYDFIAYWNWSPNGWLNKLGVYDYAGGTVVHINGGATGLILAYFLDGLKKKKSIELPNHNIVNIIIGTFLLWFGWFGFNAGSGYKADVRSGYAFYNSNLAACVGGLTWMILGNISSSSPISFKDWKYSITNFCSGSIAGLVAITPAAGFVNVWSSPIFGITASISSFYASILINNFGFNDYLNVFGCHGVSGLVGSILTGVFASKKVASYSGTDIKGGWVNGNFVQVPIQLLASITTLAWASLITYILCHAINYFSVFKFEQSDAEDIDMVETGEFAYNYVQIKDVVIIESEPETLENTTVEKSSEPDFYYTSSTAPSSSR
ncbi:Ammonium transporter 1 [Smittium mucronatum]|uniref:Ammonium transporter n=1 Tax=Smittium mucronatum TaxID=133383 RepID=A0A1R0H2K7_9FUNG|nr:Ammonium transporter 1 [Smittium mucronatum]